MAADPFNLDDLLGNRRPGPKPEVQEKGVQLRGRDFNGTWYIRGEDVVGLLEANKVLPKISARIRARLKQSG